MLKFRAMIFSWRIILLGKLCTIRRHRRCQQTTILRWLSANCCQTWFPGSQRLRWRSSQCWTRCRRRGALIRRWIIISRGILIHWSNLDLKMQSHIKLANRAQINLLIIMLQLWSSFTQKEKKMIKMAHRVVGNDKQFLRIAKLSKKSWMKNCQKMRRMNASLCALRASW